jgi:hypothetical protein
MTEDEARTILLEDALDNAVQHIIFMHGCLTRPGQFSYAYPNMTQDLIAKIRKLTPEPNLYCHHSKFKDDCERCQNHREYMTRRHEAQQILDAIS